MASKSKLSETQKEVARQMRDIRLKLGMTMPSFGAVIGMRVTTTHNREGLAAPWTEEEVQKALEAIRRHLKESLEMAEEFAVMANSSKDAARPKS